MNLREDFLAMTSAEVTAISRERADTPTARAQAAQQELRRRRLLAGEARDRDSIAVAFSQMRGTWQLTSHAADWEEWEAWVRRTIYYDRVESARGIRLKPSNHCAVTYRVPPRGVGWTFWPPHNEPMPERLIPLAEELVRRGVIE